MTPCEQTSGWGFELGAAQERRERGHEPGGRATVASHLQRQEPALSAIRVGADTSVGYGGAGPASAPVLPFLSLIPTLSSPQSRVGRKKILQFFLHQRKNPPTKRLKPSGVPGRRHWVLGQPRFQTHPPERDDDGLQKGSVGWWGRRDVPPRP